MKSFFIITTFFMTQLFAQVEVAQLPDDLAKKTISLNPDFLIYGKDQIKEGEKVPLLIYLHGARGIGQQIHKVERQPHRLLKTIKKAGRRCLCVAPQAMKSPHDRGEKGGWVPADLDLLFQHLRKTLPIDEKRSYLNGNSMGGYGTIAWAAHSPDHFAAIAPMVGGLGPGGPKDVSPNLDSWGKNLTKIPMKAYYGRDDRVVPADRGDMIMKAIKKSGGIKAELIVLENEGHGAGRIPATDPEFVKWLFAQKND